MAPLDGLLAAGDEIANHWSEQRAERQARRALDPADFGQLADAGFLRAAVPEELGGTWTDLPTSARPLCQFLRRLAAADSSVALVSAMHPAVLSFWLASPDPDQPEWETQRRAVLSTANDGTQWGTVTSEPGSGGDIARTRTVATPIAAPAVPAASAGSTAPAGSVDRDGAVIPGRTYELTGDKHFGSGLGVADFMFTTAKVDGEDDPAAYVLDVRDLDAVGKALQVTAPWDGAGMAATQSHAVRLESMPATRLAWGGQLAELQLNNGGFVMALFISVVLGVVDAAMAEGQRVLTPRHEGLRAYEQTEWARADADYWLACAAYDRLIATVEAGDPARSLHAGLRAKVSIAELAEQIVSRVSRVVGGGAYSRRSPLSYWYEDVRALGFLRPPWALTYDNVFGTSWG